MQSGCFWAKWLFGQSGCIRAKLVVFLAKVVVLGQNWLHSGKVVVFGQRLLYSSKVVVFGKTGLYSGKKGCIWTNEVVFGKVVLFG